MLLLDPPLEVGVDSVEDRSHTLKILSTADHGTPFAAPSPGG
jgi:hypothetical protein